MIIKRLEINLDTIYPSKSPLFAVKHGDSIELEFTFLSGEEIVTPENVEITIYGQRKDDERPLQPDLEIEGDLVKVTLNSSFTEIIGISKFEIEFKSSTSTITSPTYYYLVTPRTKNGESFDISNINKLLTANEEAKKNISKIMDLLLLMGDIDADLITDLIARVTKLEEDIANGGGGNVVVDWEEIENARVDSTGATHTNLHSRINWEVTTLNQLFNSLVKLVYTKLEVDNKLTAIKKVVDDNHSEHITDVTNLTRGLQSVESNLGDLATVVTDNQNDTENSLNEVKSDIETTNTNLENLSNDVQDLGSELEDTNTRVGDTNLLHLKEVVKEILNNQQIMSLLQQAVIQNQTDITGNRESMLDLRNDLDTLLQTELPTIVLDLAEVKNSRTDGEGVDRASLTERLTVDYGFTHQLIDLINSAIDEAKTDYKGGVHSTLHVRLLTDYSRLRGLIGDNAEAIADILDTMYTKDEMNEIFESLALYLQDLVGRLEYLESNLIYPVTNATPVVDEGSVTVETLILEIHNSRKDTTGDYDLDVHPIKILKADGTRVDHTLISTCMMLTTDDNGNSVGTGFYEFNDEHTTLEIVTTQDEEFTIALHTGDKVLLVVKFNQPTELKHIEFRGYYYQMHNAYTKFYAYSYDMFNGDWNYFNRDNYESNRVLLSGANPTEHNLNNVDTIYTISLTGGTDEESPTDPDALPKNLWEEVHQARQGFRSLKNKLDAHMTVMDNLANGIIALQEDTKSELGGSVLANTIAINMFINNHLDIAPNPRVWVNNLKITKEDYTLVELHDIQSARIYLYGDKIGREVCFKTIIPLENTISGSRVIITDTNNTFDAIHYIGLVIQFHNPTKIKAVEYDIEHDNPNDKQEISSNVYKWDEYVENSDPYYNQFAVFNSSRNEIYGLDYSNPPTITEASGTFQFFIPNAIPYTLKEEIAEARGVWKKLDSRLDYFENTLDMYKPLFSIMQSEINDLENTTDNIQHDLSATLNLYLTVFFPRLKAVEHALGIDAGDGVTPPGKPRPNIAWEHLSYQSTNLTVWFYTNDIDFGITNYYDMAKAGLTENSNANGGMARTYNQYNWGHARTCVCVYKTDLNGWADGLSDTVKIAIFNHWWLNSVEWVG